MERVEHTFKVFDNFIEITPKNGVKDNSVYEIRIKKVKALNKNKTIDDLRIKTTTRLTPSYCSLEAVHSLVDSYDIPDEKTLYYIREASLFAEYVKKESYTDDNVPFEVFQYVKHKAAYDSLMKFYVERSAEGGTKGTLGDISFENSSTFPAIKDLLDVLKTEVDKWVEHMRGNGFEGRVAPASAVRGARSTPGSPYGLRKVGRYVPGHPYGTTFSGMGFSRDVGRS
ncbi:hypothetical protein [Heyndrickxia sporothermodurans]|jgi:hypothetical protein|uniref:hypothetical protein n=1 Tax=Heyndrickxia sporothermodurans TaxID=46224 RepID=UPI000D33905F|nr:hypothetical protein [Heyndrickxia sporothermodurans]PTY92890.1 hypothetical protein B5V90_02090 [Heyndrickxia sporothermodurans]